MAISICLEKMGNRWIAYATSLPGCFASHEQRDAALAAVPQAVNDYLDWCRWNGVAIAGVDPNEPLQIDEMILEWFFPGGEPVNAFFAADAAPISSAERMMAAALLDWTRADLLKAIDGLSPEIMDQVVEDEWSIKLVFYHTMALEWHYLHVLGLVPDWVDPSAKGDLAAVLEWTQSLYLAALPDMVDQNHIVQIDGEVWTPRKTLRRALWHRRNHTAHIYQFREKLGING